MFEGHHEEMARIDGLDVEEGHKPRVAVDDARLEPLGRKSARARTAAMIFMTTLRPGQARSSFAPIPA
jgi:hypothetical protein